MATQFLLKDKIKATKYYETSTPINSDTGKNEADICLSLINSTLPSVNTTFLGGEQLSAPGTNLKFTDPTGSICSQTFAISAVYNVNENISDEVVKNDILIGIDKDSNSINTFISKDSNSEPFLENYLKIETTKNLGPFNSTDSLFQATFKEDTSDLLSMAVNSAYNQNDKKGLLKIAEDTTYNNSYALGKSTTKYFTENANSKQLEVHDISSDNRVSTNKINIQTIPNNTPINNEKFGTFKFVTAKPQVNVTTSADVTTLPFLLAPTQVETFDIALEPDSLVKKMIISGTDYFHISEVAFYDSNNKKLVYQTDFTLSGIDFYDPNYYTMNMLVDNDSNTYIHSIGNSSNNFIVEFTDPNGIFLSKFYLQNLIDPSYDSARSRLKNYVLNIYDKNDTKISDEIKLSDVSSLYSEADDYSVLFKINGDNNSGINYTNLPSSLTVDEYKELFGDTINTGFKIEVTKNQNTGFNFVNSSDNTYANLINNTIVDNVDYVKNIASLTHSLEIAQEPMRIDSDINNSDDNSEYFSLSTNGEKLSFTNYNTDGEIKLGFDAPNNRITNVTSSNSFEVIVDYDTLTEELKTTKDVSYELIDYSLPTGQGQYDSFADSNGASLYTIMDAYSIFDFTSSIDVDNSIKLIKITPTFNVDAVAMYKLNDDDSLGSQIPVDITASLSELSSIPIDAKLRSKLLSKKISDLGIQSVNNDLLIQDTINPTIDSNKWNLFFDSEYNNEYLMSSLLATSNPSNFPLVDKSTSMINNNESLDVTLSYVTVSSSNNTGTLFDSVKIQYDDITSEISQQSLEFFNESQKINYYELLTDTTVSDYQIVKYMITEQYQAKFMFPLSVFGNILMTTPLLNSVITTYLYYSLDTVITIGANNDTITASKNKVLIPSISTDITNLYKSTDVVSLAGSNTNDNVVLNFSINKKSLTPMNSVFQIKSSETESWENIGDIIRDIDTYYGANQTIINQLGNSAKVIICPTITSNTDETLQLIDETYVIPLQVNIDNLNLNIKGCNYPISNLLSLDLLTNPTDFINNDLPIGTNMNLSVDYSGTKLQDFNEYSLTIYVKDGNNTIATIHMEITSFFGTFVIAKNAKPLFYVDRTLTDSVPFINGDFSQSDPYLVNPTGNVNTRFASNNNLVPGWNIDAVFIPTNNSWSYPTFSHGANGISLQMTSFIEQTIYLNIGTYTVSFWLVGRPGGGPNPIDIQLNGTTINTISPPTTVWTNYSVTFTVSAAGNNTIRFAGTVNYTDLSTALQDVSITTTTSPTRYLIIGDESVSDGSLTGVSSGVIDMTDGVRINYTDLSQDEYLKFNLLSDKIAVSNAGSAGTPQYITHLDYESTNCEKVSIPYYRGYLNDNTTQTYKIVRKDLVSVKVKATDTYVSNVTGVYVNKEHVINFNDTISIGNKVKLLFSRLPNNILQNKKYTMNINVVGDSVKITSIYNNTETVINKTLLNYLLYDFNTGTQLVSKGIQISSNLQYSIIYKEIGGKIYFIHDYKTNPSNIVWPSEHIVNLDDVTNLTTGTTISNTGLDENGYIKFTFSKDTLLDKISYLVYAPPYLYATQATKYASNVFPFDIADSASELKTIYFPSTNYTKIIGSNLIQNGLLNKPTVDPGNMNATPVNNWSFRTSNLDTNVLPGTWQVFNGRRAYAWWEDGFYLTPYPISEAYAIGIVGQNTMSQTIFLNSGKYTLTFWMAPCIYNGKPSDLHVCLNDVELKTFIYPGNHSFDSPPGPPGPNNLYKWIKQTLDINVNSSGNYNLQFKTILTTNKYAQIGVTGIELTSTKYLYTPFTNITNTNNVTFTASTLKSFADYNDSSKNIGVQTINITGSNIKLTELKTNNSNNPSNNGPNRDGVIYDGKIGDLTNFSSDYIKLLSNENGVFQISYLQDLEGLFGQTPRNNNDEYRGNILINIGNSVLPNINIILHNQVKNGSIVSIYDIYQVNRNNTLELYLLKYVYDTLINYSNVSGNAYIKRFPGKISKLYYSQVQMPSINLGDNINNVLKTITKSNLLLDGNNIVWTEKLFFSNNLTLQVSPLTQNGILDMMTLFYTNKDIPINYTIVNIPNAYEIINGDGTYQTIITGLGKIKTQVVNTSDTPINTDIDLSLIDNLTPNYAYNNSALYDKDIPLDIPLKSIDDILFKFE